MNNEEDLAQQVINLRRQLEDAHGRLYAERADGRALEHSLRSQNAALQLTVATLGDERNAAESEAAELRQQLEDLRDEFACPDCAILPTEQRPAGFHCVHCDGRGTMRAADLINAAKKAELEAAELRAERDWERAQCRILQVERVEIRAELERMRARDECLAHEASELFLDDNTAESAWAFVSKFLKDHRSQAAAAPAEWPHMKAEDGTDMGPVPFVVVAGAVPPAPTGGPDWLSTLRSEVVYLRQIAAEMWSKGILLYPSELRCRANDIDPDACHMIREAQSAASAPTSGPACKHLWSELLDSPCPHCAAQPASAAPTSGPDRKARECQRVVEDLLPKMREAARSKGYALAVHGSLTRDVDLIAVPWTDDAASADVLAAAVRNSVSGVFATTASGDPQPEGPKPHGRRSWAIGLGPGYATYVDISVMPRAAQPAVLPAPTSGPGHTRRCLETDDDPECPCAAQPAAECRHGLPHLACSLCIDPPAAPVEIACACTFDGPTQDCPIHGASLSAPTSGPSEVMIVPTPAAEYALQAAGMMPAQPAAEFADGLAKAAELAREESLRWQDLRQRSIEDALWEFAEKLDKHAKEIK